MAISGEASRRRVQRQCGRAIISSQKGRTSRLLIENSRSIRQPSIQTYVIYLSLLSKSQKKSLALPQTVDRHRQGRLGGAPHTLGGHERHADRERDDAMNQCPERIAVRFDVA